MKLPDHMIKIIKEKAHKLSIVVSGRRARPNPDIALRLEKMGEFCYEVMAEENEILSDRANDAESQYMENLKVTVKLQKQLAEKDKDIQVLTKQSTKRLLKIESKDSLLGECREALEKCDFYFKDEYPGQDNDAGKALEKLKGKGDE